MREIKFRVWDNEKKQYFTPTFEAYDGKLEYLMLGKFGDICMVKMKPDRQLEIVHESIFPGRFEKEFYTGIKDKNGVEIYDGDTDKNGNVISWCDKRNGWSLKIFDSPTKEIIECNCYNCAGYFELSDVIITLEIIVNIHQNPELL